MKTLIRSFYDIFRNGTSSIMFIAVITITVFIVSTFFSVLYNLNKINSFWSTNATVIVFPKLNEEEDLKELMRKLSTISELSSLSLLEQDDVLKILKERFPSQNVNISAFQLPRLIELKLDVRGLDGLVENLKDFEGIEDFVVNAAWFDKLNRLIHALNYIVSAIAILTLLLSLVLLSYVSRVAALERKPEIQLMRLFGATDWYIRRPYMISGVILGFVAGLLGLILYVLIDTFVKGVAQYFISTWFILPISHMAAVWALAIFLAALANFFALTQTAEYD